MAELIVVSSIVLVSLVSMYGSFIKIHSAYKTKMSYYDVATLYRLGYYRDVLRENKVNDTTSKLDEVKNEVKNDKIIELYNSKTGLGIDEYVPKDDKIENIFDRVFIVYNNRNSINSNIFDGISDINVTFLDYVDYISGNVDFNKFEYMMIMERCNNQVDDEIDDTDNCKYAYLEILNDVES